MSYAPLIHPTDTPDLRKARGAFFTPDEITAFIAQWAITSDHDRTPSNLSPATFLATMVNRVLEAAR